ncbi:MAG: hypothetical protein ACOZAQ_07015 [Pseudomonadota bacterium]
MGSDSACRDLRESIGELRAILEQLALTQAELDLSLTRSVPDQPLLDRYSQQLEHLAEADRKRVEALRGMTLDTGRMAAAIGRCQDVDLASLWDEVREQLPGVALNNRKHAQFLQRAAVGIRNSLVLLGVLPSQPPLYGPSGQKQGGSVLTRPLGSA